MGMDTKPVLRATGVIALDLHDWIACDEKAHGIIQERLSDLLLLKTQACDSAKELWKELHKILEAPNVSSAFYIFQELFSIAWDGNSRVLEHIASLRTSESRLTAIKFTVNAKVMAFILLNSLLNTPKWELFKTSFINTMEDAKLTFDTAETQIITEDTHLCLSGHSESAMKASSPLKSSARPPNSSTWCEHHLSASHNSADCKTYIRWVIKIRNGDFKRPDRDREKANAAEGTPGAPDSVNVVHNNVSVFNPAYSCLLVV